ncbi:MAG: MFS transporter [Burkholderiaceae bacterium]|nr:MFS transporter [Burkholderiaceae bacterium]
MTLSSHTLRLLGLAAFASMASMRVCDPMLLTLSQEFQTGTGEAAAVVSAFAVAYGVMQLFYGPLGDRLGKLRVVWGATLACALLNGVTALAPGLGWLVGGRVALGAAAAGIIPLTMAWIGDQVPYAQRQETLARLMVATVSGMMAGQWFGGFAAEFLGWRVAFALLSALFAGAALLLYPILRDLPPAPVGPADASREPFLRKTLHLLRLPRVRWVLAVTLVEGALAFGAMAFVPSRLGQGFGMSASAAGGAMVLFGVGGLLYSLFARRWLQWLGERWLARVGGTLIAAGLGLLVWGGEVRWAMAGCAVFGLGFYMLHNLLQTQATKMAPEARGTAVTLFACVLFLGQSLGVLAMAASADRGLLSAMFLLAAGGLWALGGWIAHRLPAQRA